MEKSQNIIVLFLATLTALASARLMPVFEPDSNNNQIIFQIAKPLILACKSDDMKQITWLKGNKSVDSIPGFSNHYKIIKEEGKFIIEKAREEDAGTYWCQQGNEKADFEVFAQVIVRIPENIYVVEKEKLEIICVVRGTDPNITWQFSNSTDENSQPIELNEDERIKLEEHDDIDGSRLVIEHVELSDRGVYTCVGTNKVMTDRGIKSATSDGMVRVKDKLAALWPFLGICAEVFILCTIILIYEKRRNKTDLDESDTDQSPDQKSDQKR